MTNNLCRSLYWKLNWYRQSELDGALLLGRAVRAASDSSLIVALTHHAADEAHHASLWAKAIESTGSPCVRISRSYQSYYADFGAMPVSLPEVLALTHVFERRVWRQFQRELAHPAWPEVVRSTFDRLLEDERRHLDWIERWLAGVSGSAMLLDRFTEIDRQVYERLSPYEDCLWEIPGLGSELEPAPTNHGQPAAGE